MLNGEQTTCTGEAPVSMEVDVMEAKAMGSAAPRLVCRAHVILGMDDSGSNTAAGRCVCGQWELSLVWRQTSCNMCCGSVRRPKDRDRRYRLLYSF